MRKTITRLTAVLAFVLLYSSSFGQVFFTEDFEGAMNPVTDLPANWTESGLSTDSIWRTGNATAATSPYLTWPNPTNGTIFAYTNDDACNCDKSNDRMFLPVQNFSGYSAVGMTFDLYLNGGYAETGYVLVSNNGGTTFDTVYTAVGNATLWQDGISVGLNAYAGDTAVLICFAYNDASTWAYAMGVDDVVLTQLASAEDLEAISSAGEYSIIPLPMASAMVLEATVTNNGVTNVLDAVLTTNVWSSTNGFSTPIQTTASGNTTLNINDTIPISSGTFTPAAQASYIFEHIISSSTIVDGQPTNDTVMYAFEVSGLEYARDDSVPTIGLGIGAGTDAVLGNNYNFPVTADLISVRFVCNAVAVGDTTELFVYNTDGSGMPTTLVTSVPYIFPVAGPAVQEIMFPGGLNLPAGNYFFGVEEAVTVANYGLQGCASIFTPNTSWGSIAGGPWDAIENLGFDVTFVVRPQLAPPCQNSSSTANASICDGDIYMIGSSSYTTAGTYVDTLSVPGGCDSVVTTILTVNSLPAVSFSGLASAYCDTAAVAPLTGTPAGGTFSGPGVTGSSFDPGAAGIGMHDVIYVYADSMGCSNSDTVGTEVSLCVGIDAGMFSDVQVSPNPNQGRFMVKGLEAGMEMRLYDVAGKLVLAQTATMSEARINLESQPAGMYFLRIAFEGNVAQLKVVVE